MPTLNIEKDVHENLWKILGKIQSNSEKRLKMNDVIKILTEFWEINHNKSENKHLVKK